MNILAISWKDMLLVLSAILFIILQQTDTANASEDDGTSNTYKMCMDNSGGVTADMMDCIETETKNLEATIVNEYSRLSKSLSDEKLEQLEKAANTWKKYRKEMTDFIYDPEGGSTARINANSWRLDTTARFAQILKAHNE